jgi:hypothetical protein
MSVAATKACRRKAVSALPLDIGPGAGVGVDCMSRSLAPMATRRCNQMQEATS